MVVASVFKARTRRDDVARLLHLGTTEGTRTSAQKATASPLNVCVVTGTLPTMAAAVAPPPGSGPPKGGGSLAGRGEPVFCLAA